MTKGEAQRRIWTFYEAVKYESDRIKQLEIKWGQRFLRRFPVSTDAPG
jgi:hypothetical protein